MNRRNKTFFLFITLLVFGQCEYKDVPPNGSRTFVDCTQSLLAIAVQSKIDATACNLIDGSIAVSATAGTAPYAFSINGGVYQTSPSFSNLGPGVYTLTVKDFVQCQRSIAVSISYPNPTFTVSVDTVADTDCLSPNGQLTVTASGGTGPYTYQFGTGAAGSTNVFAGLRFGIYTITVKDSSDPGGCPLAISATVPRGQTGVSYQTVIKPIINASCAISGCHNGDNGAPRNWTIYDNVHNNAQNIKTRTENKSMPLTGSLTQDQISLIACWVDDGALNN